MAGRRKRRNPRQVARLGGVNAIDNCREDVVSLEALTQGLSVH